jgi:hypothetical protein
MPRKNDVLADAEALVRRVLSKHFKQKLDPDTVRAVAEKISQVVEESAPKKVSSAPKKKAA